VVKNKTKPFIVRSSEQEVKVLGTHFNINSYENEAATVTTLLKGSVKVDVLTGSSSTMLKPGEQSILNRGELIARMQKANIDQTMAWKNGSFMFLSDDFPVVMRQIARWYDVKIQYKGKMPHFGMTGEASRNLTLDQIVEILKSSGLKVEMQGKTIIVED